MGLPHKKRILARGLDLLGINRLLLGLQKRICRPFIRAVNYHRVPARCADVFERQVRYYAKHFSPVGVEDLEALLRGEWRHPKPGLIISFDDGHRDHVEVAAPLLEKYGFIGWFFVPTGFIDTPPPQQAEWARGHRIAAADDDPHAPAVAMAWEHVRELDQRHVVGCHTHSHCRLSAELTNDELRREIPEAKRRMEEALGREVPIFCWVGGEEYAYSRRAAEMVRQAGFRLGFMTNTCPITPRTDRLQLQRSNIESDWSMAVVRFQLSGFLDVLYTRKRRRINRLTRG